MIDPELKYCPQCHDEYRAEIERCAECEISLITGIEMLELEKGGQEKSAAPKDEITPDDQLAGEIPRLTGNIRNWKDLIIDPELKYCPQCHDEYRAEYERCAECEILLITGTEMQELEKGRQEKLATSKDEIAPDDQLMVIERGSLSEVRYLQELMAAEGIATRVVGEDRSCGGSCCSPTVLLQVRPEEAADALRIMAAEHRRSTALDHHHSEHGDAVFDFNATVATCPACGSTFSTTIIECPDCGLCFG
jgi:hypothetical protein